MTYAKYEDSGFCCVSSNQDHQSCYCDITIAECKLFCDKDVNCKGYVGRVPNGCNIATTSSCSAIDCSGPIDMGNVGKLMNTCTVAESSSNGCYIKLGNIKNLIYQNTKYYALQSVSYTSNYRY